MSKLSIFVDESGDFDLQSKHSPYYIISLVFHEQDKNIEKQINSLNSKMLENKFKYYLIHSAPLIRREYPYKNLEINDRKKIFNIMYNFTRKCDVACTSFSYHKKHFDLKEKILSKMARELSVFISDKLDYFNKFENIIVYYDNGQLEIFNILNIVLNTLLSNVLIKKVLPADYKLFQVADFICTTQLLKLKLTDNTFSNSEKKFFSNTKEIKTIIKTIDAMILS